MSTRHETIQHWILNTAFEIPRWISDFLPFAEGLHLNVREVPGATPDEYTSAFLSLIDAGLIDVYTRSQDALSELTADRSVVEDVLERRLLLPRVSSRIRASRNQPRPQRAVRAAESDFKFRLSVRGGEAWESRAEPDWRRYLDTLTGEKDGDAWCASRDLLIAALGWYRELNSSTIDRSTIILEQLQDHPITYWKRLSLVYHASFVCAWSEECYSGEEHRLAQQWFQEWWRSLNQWYKKPWELPDWPGQI